MLYLNSYFFILSFFASGLGLILTSPFSAVAMARLMGIGGFCELVFETGPKKRPAAPGDSRPGPREAKKGPGPGFLGGGWGGQLGGALCPARSPRSRGRRPVAREKNQILFHMKMACSSAAWPAHLPAAPGLGAARAEKKGTPFFYQPHVPQIKGFFLAQPAVPQTVLHN